MISDRPNIRDQGAYSFMFGGNKLKQIARDGASEWADEALEMFGFNAEAEIREQMDIHPYPAR